MPTLADLEAVVAPLEAAVKDAAAREAAEDPSPVPQSMLDRLTAVTDSINQLDQAPPVV